MSGKINIADNGKIINLPDVVANTSIPPVKKLEDWYQFTQANSTSFRLDFRYDTLTSSDLDIYLFQKNPNGTMTFVSRSTKPASTSEVINITNLVASTYFIAIQANATSSAATKYWFRTR